MSAQGGVGRAFCIDPSANPGCRGVAIISHRIPLEEAPAAYEHFRKKTDNCIKVVIKPGIEPTGLRNPE